ncbi:MAG: lipopolysaccharide biosynthesis protein [Thermoleophilaceae bacterium]
MATDQTGSPVEALAREGALAQEAARAVPWTMLNYATGKALSLISTIVLARLLVPSDFGLLAVAGLLIGAISVFTYEGLGSAVVIEQDMERRELSAALGFLTSVGFGGALLGVLLSPLVGVVFDVKGATGVVAATSAGLALSGVSSFYYGLVLRDLRAKVLFVGEIVQGIAALGVSIGLAVAGAGVWSLVAGNLTGGIVYLVWVVAASRVHLRPGWDGATVRRFWNSGKGFLAHNGLWWASANADNALVARFAGTGSLGAYSTAYRVSEVPDLAIADAVAQVSFPSFTRLRSQGLDVTRPYLRVAGLVAFAACPLAVLLSATADPFVHTMLGSHWNQAIGPIGLLGIAGAVLPVTTSQGWLLKSIGRAMTTVRIYGTILVLVIPLLAFAASESTLTAVAGVMLARGVLVLVLYGTSIRTHAGLSLRAQARPLLGVAVGCGVLWLAARGTAVALDDAPAAVALVAASAAGLAVYLLVVRVLDAELVARVRSQVSVALSKRLASPVG